MVFGDFSRWGIFHRALVGIHGKCNQYVPLDLLQIRANNNAPPCHRQVLQLYRDLCSVLTVVGLL